MASLWDRLLQWDRSRPHWGVSSLRTKEALGRTHTEGRAKCPRRETGHLQAIETGTCLWPLHCQIVPHTSHCPWATQPFSGSWRTITNARWTSQKLPTDLWFPHESHCPGKESATHQSEHTGFMGCYLNCSFFHPSPTPRLSPEAATTVIWALHSLNYF